MKRSLMLVALVFLIVPQAWSQDLDRLKIRVSEFWSARVKGDNAKARTYVEEQARSSFPLEMTKEGIVTGLEFTSDPLKVLVSLKTGDSQPVVESWIWARGDWFLHPEPAPSRPPQPTAAVTSLKFELLDRKLDLGSHKQGDTVTGSVRFTAPRAQVAIIRGRGIPGLQIKGVEWRDNNGGTINFAIDTSLMSEDVSGQVVFEPIGPLNGLDNRVIPDTATVTIRIQGKVRIVQLPQTEVGKRENMVEIEIRNVGDTRFTIETVRYPGTVSLEGEESILPPLEPGDTAVLPVYYIDKSAPLDAELTFRFSPGVVPGNSIYFRLNALKPPL